VVVLGHERCGAISATINALRAGSTVPRHIDTLVEAVRPAVDSVLNSEGDVVENAVRANALYQARKLVDAGDTVEELLHTGKLMVAAACYDLETGEVEFLS